MPLVSVRFVVRRQRADGCSRGDAPRQGRGPSFGYHAPAVNGKPGDDPITDIVKYRVAVFGAAVDMLILETVALGGENELRERGLDGLRPLPTNVERELQQIRDRRVREGRQSGWEVDRLISEAHEASNPDDSSL